MLYKIILSIINIIINKINVTKGFELVKNSIATDLDYLICNAGVSNGYGTFLNEDHDFESIEKVFKINVIGSLMTARYLSTNVIKGGKIIFISSKMGVQKHEGAIATAYRASKAALNNIMISISNELKFKGIIVTAFHPGWVRTDMGGSNATLSAEESASNLIYNFLKLKIDDTGSFFNYNGKLLNF